MPNTKKLNIRSKKYLSLVKGEGYLSGKTDNKSLEKYLRLDLGENLLGCSKHAIKTMTKIDCNILQHYADPSANNVKHAIAEIYGISPRQILIGNSSDEFIDFIARTFLDMGDKAIVVHPNFFRYVDATLSAGGKTIDIFTKEAENYEYTPQTVEEIISKSRENDVKIIWLSNPVNPTGIFITKNIIENILENTKATVILDEAFIEYCTKKERRLSINLINKHKNLLVIRTLSKAYGLAGVRFAYLMSHQENIDILSRLRDTLSMTSNVIQFIAVQALRDQDWLEKSVAKTEKLREKIFNNIRSLDKYNLGADSRTNVYLLRHEQKNLYSELKERGILVSDFSKVPGLEGKNYVRVTIGKSTDNDKLLNCLHELA